MNKIDEFLACAYDAQVSYVLDDKFEPDTIPVEFRTFIVHYLIDDETTIGEILSDYLAIKV